MEFVSIVVAAEEEELSSVGQSNAPLNEWSGIETTGFDTHKFVTLHCLLTGLHALRVTQAGNRINDARLMLIQAMLRRLRVMKQAFKQLFFQTQR